MSNIPGTVLVKDEEIKDIFVDALVPLMKITGGLMLSQICEITGLETATIQNWVKRGFVRSPEAKKYSKEQVARILIINSLRDTMQIDKIATLLSYLNGNLLDTSDDIITDSELYMYFCKVVFELEELKISQRKIVFQCIQRNLEDYTGEGKEKLEKALLVMALTYQATMLKKKAAKIFDEEIVD